MFSLSQNFLHQVKNHVLFTVFTYTDLKTFGGIDIDSIALRLQEAQKWFQQTYPGADPFEWFPRIRSRSKVIRNHLSRIKADESLSYQARLIFEAQVDFIVRLKEILIDELIHRMSWIQQSKDVWMVFSIHSFNIPKV